MAKQQQKRGGTRKHGRNKNKCAQYKGAKTRERNKIKRILRSNGIEAATIYAGKNGIKVPALSGRHLRPA